MNIAHRFALNAYNLATASRCRADAQARRTQRREPVQVVFYHRVADTHANPWTIGCDAFKRQVDWLADRFDVVSLAEGQRRVASGENERPAVVITFDDGYAENCDFALPLLLDRQLPFVYFVTSGNTESGEPFPHDAALGNPLRPNSAAEIRALADSGIEVGAHTRTHVDLATVGEKRLFDEIVGSKLDLEKMTGKPVRYFAFPYGQHANMTSAGFRIAFEAGFAGVCSAYGGYNFPGGDAFHLERFHGDPELARTKSWLSVDRRKLRAITPFDPGDYGADKDGDSSMPTSRDVSIAGTHLRIVGGA